MRKAQKETVIEFVQVLRQSHDNVGKALEKGDVYLAQQLLAACQQGAIQLGGIIEKAEGEGFPTVSCLEGYCEAAFQLYDFLDRQQSDGGQSMVGCSEREQSMEEQSGRGQAIGAAACYAELGQAFARLEESVRVDIKVRREVVFLPYKASMWDSLESVWMAADSDPECDAYVIPIPYYDKNPDGSFRKMHYEGEQYPDYVPITSYEQYDFEKNRPDMIFIHNPYDECNYVTSVHPFFYSKNLKKYTEMLVYIPYYVLSDINPGDKLAVEQMAHFCTVPGVVYADKVIVQSETMRRIYIDVMAEFMKDTSRKYWEDKILGLGSPKIDKVLHTKKEELEIPEEWNKIIQKPDGSRKKIILYNTSVTALLHHGEKMLKKMQDVFHIFEENREEVALLWRPHPLIQATISSMRPRLWKEYQKIVSGYREGGWGIYDDSAELDRAIAISDGYYGDESSVVQLCEKAKIPVLLQLDI